MPRTLSPDARPKLDDPRRKSPFRILSFDGGPGSRGALLMLHEIERHVPGFLSRTDFFVGTSAGAIVAMFLARQPKKAHAPEHALDTIRAAMDLVDDADDAFAISIPAAVKAALGVAPLANAKLLRELLDDRLAVDVFGHRLPRVPRLSEVPHRAGALAYRLGWDSSHGHGASFPTNLDDELPDEPTLNGELTAERSDNERDFTLTELALHSGGLPMFLPAADGFVDGAIYSNSPGATAVSSVLGKVSWARRNRQVVAELEDIRLLALSSNFAALPEAFAGMRTAGWRKWLANPAVPLAMLELMINAISRGQRDLLYGLLGGSYRRPVLPGTGQHVGSLFGILFGLHHELRDEAVAALRCFRECEFDGIGKTALEDQVHWARREWMVDGDPQRTGVEAFYEEHRRTYVERTVAAPSWPGPRVLARMARGAIDGTALQLLGRRVTGATPPRTRDLLESLDDPAARKALCGRAAFNCECLRGAAPGA